MFSVVDAVDAACDLVVVRDKGTAHLFPAVLDRRGATFDTPAETLSFLSHKLDMGSRA